MKTQKNLNVWMMMFVALLFSWSIQAQDIAADSTGLPGDNFSLEGALELFKDAKTPEDFEKALNTEDNYVNNLDLNEDGDIDYVRVIDNMDGDVHAIVLQVPVTNDESQDIAVIEIEKTGPESAILQIVGDAGIYGEDKIVEPYQIEEKETGKGPSADLEIIGITVNVYGWVGVRYIYRPSYSVWVSPFRFGIYPRWWKPWRPRPWRAFYPRVAVYRPRYRVVSTHRVVRAHKVYTPKRRTSRVVTTRTTTRVAVKGKNGKVVAGKKTTTTKAVKGKNGKVAAGKKTTTTKKYNGQRNTVTRKKTTTTGVKRGRNGAAAGRKSTTKTVRKKRKGN